MGQIAAYPAQGIDHKADTAAFRAFDKYHIARVNKPVRLIRQSLGGVHMFSAQGVGQSLIKRGHSGTDAMHDIQGRHIW